MDCGGIVVGGCLLWLVVAVGVGSAIGHIIRLRDRAAPTDERNDPQ